MEHRIIYLRDSYTVVDGKQRPGQPVGAVAIKLRNRRAYAEYHVSTLNPQDHFDRGVARQLALGRLIETPHAVPLPHNASMHDISEAVMHDITLNKDLPHRARRAAKLWLKHVHA